MMKRIIKDKKFFVPAASFTVLLLILLILQLVYSYRAVKAGNPEKTSVQEEKIHSGWNVQEARLLKKDILWYEQLMEMSKNDSIGLVIDLSDSIAQINLKGLYLVQTPILRQYPAGFFQDINEETYTRFATLSSIVQETANHPKKPVKKVIAFNPQDENREEQNSGATDRPLFWSFTTGNDIKVVVTGVKTAPDSTLAFHPVIDLIKYRLRETIRQPFPETYKPTLYLWLSDRDAKSIYRAVSSRGDVLFRN